MNTMIHNRFFEKKLTPNLHFWIYLMLNYIIPMISLLPINQYHHGINFIWNTLRKPQGDSSENTAMIQKIYWVSLKLIFTKYENPNSNENNVSTMSTQIIILFKSEFIVQYAIRPSVVHKPLLVSRRYVIVYSPKL